MVEIIILLIVTALVFGLFFLVFLLKKGTAEQPVQFHSCGNCNCHRSNADAHRAITSPATGKSCRDDPNHAAKVHP